MTSKVSAIDLRHHLGELLNRVNLHDERFVVERNGKPLAAIVPVWVLVKLEEEKTEFFRQVEEMRKSASKTPRKILDNTIKEAIDFVKKDKDNYA